jgi:hypothetical protein
MVLSRGQICCGSWGLNAVVDELFLRHSSAEPDTWRRIAITVRARFRLTENAGAAGLPRPQQHHTHGAIHRAVADALQGFLHLKLPTFEPWIHPYNVERTPSSDFFRSGAAFQRIEHCADRRKLPPRAECAGAPRKSLALPRRREFAEQMLVSAC